MYLLFRCMHVCLVGRFFNSEIEEISVRVGVSKIYLILANGIQPNIPVCIMPFVFIICSLSLLAYEISIIIVLFRSSSSSFATLRFALVTFVLNDCLSLKQSGYL